MNRSSKKTPLLMLPISPEFARATKGCRGKTSIPCYQRADVVSFMRQFPQAATPEWPAIREQAIKGAIKHAWFPG